MCHGVVVYDENDPLAVYCLEPPVLANGGFRLSTNSTIAGTIVDYYCLNIGYKLSGPSRIVCQKDGHYNTDPPVCIGNQTIWTR